MEMPTAAGRLVCEALATLVSYFNRPLVIIGGGVAADDGSLLAAAAYMVIDGLFSPSLLRQVDPAGSPSTQR
jgi:predicted NBD/HSP70 family sugar kinase